MVERMQRLVFDLILFVMPNSKSDSGLQEVVSKEAVRGVKMVKREEND